ncbi:hypothetical protein G9A89_007347 [Geosiphon pyriformis]|nr:hypothetical protein G9A89_007347 [Geosiphon pyriformis]
MGLVFTQHPKKTFRTNPNKHHPKVAKSENIGANHLGFAKSLFQYYCQHLGLNHNHISAESAFNFYINKKIFSLLGTPVNTESARETFYRELIQNTNLPTNYNFTSIITEINKEIKHHTQQRYPITYASKGKGKLQTPTIIPRKIQLPTWKKTRVKSPTNSSYHYTSRSTINILSTGISTSNMTSVFEQFSFQKLSEKEEEEESEDQEFTYQNLITENSKVETLNLQTQQNLNLEDLEIETPNIQEPLNQNNQNPNLINQPDLSSMIVIKLLPVELIGQPPQQPHQQIQQPLVLLQQPSQPNLDPMTYAPIVKFEKFTSEENDT